MAKRSDRILVVDDDRIILDSMREMLNLEGYDVAGAADLNAALAALDAHRPDVVISDINMSGGDGFELLRTIKDRRPEAAVIMITGYGTIESAVEAIKMGAYDYLTKPIIDEEHKSRGDDTGLGNLLANTLLTSAAARRICLTATPVELGARRSP